MNKDGSYTRYDNESNMILFREFLEFVEYNYYFNSGGWLDSETDKNITREDIFWEFMKTKVKQK